MKRRLKRIGRWLLRLAGTGAVLILAGAAYLYDYPRVAADLPEAALAYRDAGLPWTAQDLAPKPPIHPQENAAPLLREAMRAWPHHLSRGEWIFEDRLQQASLYGEPVDPLLVPLKSALDKVHDAVRRPRLGLQRDWDLDADSSLPEERFANDAAKALAARAAFRADQGDDTGALDDLQDARRLGALVGSQPTPLAVGLGATCEARALTAAQTCLAKAANDVGRLDRYRAWLAEPAPIFNLHRALRGAIYANIAGARNAAHYGTGTYWNPFTYGDQRDPMAFDSGPVPEPDAVLCDGLPDLQRPRAYMDRTLRLWTALAARTHGLTDSMERIQAESDALYTEQTQAVPTLSHRLDWAIFGVRPSARINRDVTARRALTLAFAEALIEHARTGRWPAHIPVPDSLGEGTLQTRVDKDGRFRVWSVGDDGRDDGGRASSETTSTHGSDLVAAYPPIPHHYSKVPPQGPPPGY